MTVILSAFYVNDIFLDNNNEALINNAIVKDEENSSTNTKDTKMTLRSSLLSVTCILHLYWLFVHALRFVTFIGLLNQFLLETLKTIGEFQEITHRQKRGKIWFRNTMLRL